MSLRLRQLCVVLVEQSFGHTAGLVFETLGRCGRLTLSKLQQRTRLPLRRLAPAIAILVQHHILLYNENLDDERIYYQVDWEVAYSLLRVQKITALVSGRHGDAAGKLMETVQQLGHASVADLAEELGVDSETGSKRDSGVDISGPEKTESEANGVSARGEDDEKIPMTLSTFHNALSKLLRAGFLIKMIDRSYMSAAELEEEAKYEVLAQMKEEMKSGQNSKSGSLKSSTTTIKQQVKSGKKRIQFDERCNSLKRQWREEEHFDPEQDATPSVSEAQRGAHEGSRKRVKFNNGGSGIEQTNGTLGDSINGGHEETRETIASDLVVRVNYFKCMVARRSQRLEALAERHYGPMTAAVYAATLRCAEKKNKGLRLKTNTRGDADESEDSDAEDDHDDDGGREVVVVEDREVLDSLDLSLDLAWTMQGAPQPNGTNKTRDLNLLAAGIKTETDLEDEGSDQDIKVEGPVNSQQSAIAVRTRMLRLIRLHLGVLTEHKKAFIARHDAEKGESFLDFHALADVLLQDEIDDMIHARFGKPALRLVRLLRSKGKLTERQICQMSFSLLPDVRYTLTQLHFAGIVEAQEIPKDQYRKAERSAYLWTYDQKLASSIFLQQSYRGMARSLQRLVAEREGKYSAVLEKAEYVRGESGLNKHEKGLLHEWSQVEERLLAQVTRIDDLVEVLRDYGERNTGLLV